MAPIFNICARKVGGLWFVRIGRMTLCFSISAREYRPLKGTAR